jgi:hypothetical protein
MLRAQQIKSLLHHFNACGGSDEIGNPSGTRTRFSCLRDRVPTHRRTGHLKTLAEASGHAPQPSHVRRSVRFPTGGGSLVRFGFHEENWQPRMDLHHQPSASEAGALLLSYGAIATEEMDPPAGVAPA